MLRPHLSSLARILLGLAVMGFVSCGADNQDSPTKLQADTPPTKACESVSQLAPALWSAVEDNQVTGLKAILLQLNQPSPGGNTPYLDQVLQAVFVALNEFSTDPPEVGNTDGLCNPGDTLPLIQTNRLCDLRRLLKIYVHEGTANQSLHALDPLLAGIFGYMVGLQPSASSPHYEIARDLEEMSVTSGVCSPNDTLNLLLGVTAYLTPNRSRQLVQDLENISNDPTLNGPSGLFAALAGGAVDGGADSASEYGFELIANELICAVLAVDLTTAEGRANYFQAFNNLLNGNDGNPGLYSLLPQTDAGAQLASEIQAAAADLQAMLDPSLPEPVFQPLQNVLTCASLESPGASLCDRALRPGLTPMIYHLGFEARVLTLTQLLSAVEQLVTIDAQSSQPGLLMYVLNNIIAALNADSQAPAALTELLHTIFETERPCTDSEGAVCPALPLNYQSLPDGGQGTGASPLQNGCGSGVSPSYKVPDPSCLSNVEATVPEINSLFNQGVIDELLCVIDTLVYGCAGGPQPACNPPAPLQTPDAGS